MPKATWACFLLCMVCTDAKRSDATRSGMFEEDTTRAKALMTATEAVDKGLIAAWDAPPRTESATENASLAQIGEHTMGRGKTSFCPKMVKKNAICTGELPCDVRNLVYITALNAVNLPSQFGDKVDPYVWFWVDNKDNVASTPEYQNNDHPQFDWGCPFAYDGDLNFDGEVWDSDLTADDSVGEIASSGGIKIDQKFLADYDKDGDGRFELGLFIFKNGKKVMKKKKKAGTESVVKFRFELIKAPGYEVRRIQYGGRSRGGSRRY